MNKEKVSFITKSVISHPIYVQYLFFGPLSLFLKTNNQVPKKKNNNNKVHPCYYRNFVVNNNKIYINNNLNDY